MRDAWSEEDRAHLIFPPPKPLKITPCSFVHGIRVAQIGGCLKVLSGSDGVLFDAPAVTEAIGQFKDRQDELAFGCTTFLDTSLECFGLDRGRIGRCCG